MLCSDEADITMESTYGRVVKGPSKYFTSKGKKSVLGTKKNIRSQSTKDARTEMDETIDDTTSIVSTVGVEENVTECDASTKVCKMYLAHVSQLFECM